MSLYLSFISTILLFLAFVDTSAPRGELERCSCGLEPRAEISYAGQPYDNAQPGADVIAISRRPSGETIHIEAFLANTRGRPQDVRYQTADFGRSWVKEDGKENAQASEFLQFSRSPMRYRLPLTGDRLERSSDDGKYWRRALLQLDNPPPSDSAGRPLMANQSEWRVELAAIHPTNPNTLYGCFSTLTAADKSATFSQQVTRLTGIYLSTDGGDHWSLFSDDFRRRSFEEPCLLGINPSNPNIMFLHGRSGLSVTRDGGKTWAPVGDQLHLEKAAHLKGYDEAANRLKSKNIVPPKQWPYDWTYLVIMSVVFEPRSDTVIYLVTNKGLYVTHDGGGSWCLIFTGQKTLFGVGSIFIDERNPSRLFVGSGAKIFYSKDRGCHFAEFLDSAKLRVRE